MPKRIYPILGFVVCSILVALTSFFLKKAALKITGFSSLINTYLIIGLAILVGGFFIMMASLKHGKVSKLHGIMSLTYVWTMLIGYFWLSEKISVGRIASFIIIAVGVVCITWQKQ